ncbi:MAG: protein kinase [Myxococcota bacterium]
MPRDTDDPLIGRVLAGRYRVESLIDRGGMGRVYRAVQEPIGRPVALKTLDLSDPAGEFQQRFLNEAAVQGRLSHPNTVRMFDYGRTDDGMYYITMELLVGESLHALVKREAPVDVLRVVRIARQVCLALHEAHEIGVVHRDLKPGNVFLSRQGGLRDHVKLLDFGLVKDLEAAQDLSHTGQTLGSPLYMAPEQVEGDTVDRRTDIYALGLVMWTALSGKQPFPRGSLATIMLHQVTTPVPSLKSVGIDVPPALEALIQACVAKDRKKRPDDMLRVERTLAEIESGITGIPLPEEISQPSLASQAPVSLVRPPASPSSPSWISHPASSPTNWLGLIALVLGVFLLGFAGLLALVGIGGSGVALWAVSGRSPPVPDEGLAQGFAQVTELVRCSEVVVTAPDKGLIRGEVVLTGVPRVGLRGPESLLGSTRVRAEDSGRVHIEVLGGEPGAPVEFEVVCPDIVALTTDRGEVTVGRVRGDALSVLAGSGNVTLAGASVSRLDVVVQQSADVDLGELDVEHLSVDLQGSGDLKARGAARELQVTAQGSGDASLEGLAVQTGIVHLLGSGDADVTVRRSLVARTENSGDIVYGGTPSDVDARALGSGQIRPR